MESESGGRVHESREANRQILGKGLHKQVPGRHEMDITLSQNVDNVNLSCLQSHGDTDGTDVPSTIMMHADRYTIALMSADMLSRSI